MNILKQRAGRLGGLTTLSRYGREHMGELGRLGKLPTLNEIRQQSVPKVQFAMKEGRLPADLKRLRELWKLKQRSYPAV